MAVTIEGNKAIEKASDYVIYIPETNPYFTNSLAIIPLQLFWQWDAAVTWINPETWQNPLLLSRV